MHILSTLEAPKFNSKDNLLHSIGFSFPSCFGMALSYTQTCPPIPMYELLLSTCREEGLTLIID